MKRIFWDSSGFTITELLIAALFGMMVMATLYGFYREQMYALLSQEMRTATLEDTRGALDMMIRELRNAGAWTSGTQPAGCSRIVSATATRIRIQADLNADGDCDGQTGEDVTYTLSGSTITRNGPTNPVVKNVLIPPGSDFLTYYQARSATPLSHPISDPSVIKRIKITLSVQVADPTPEGKAAGRKIVSRLSSSVEFRN